MGGGALVVFAEGGDCGALGGGYERVEGGEGGGGEPAPALVEDYLRDGAGACGEERGGGGGWNTLAAGGRQSGGSGTQTGGFGFIVAGFDFGGFALAGLRGGGGGGGGGGVVGGALLGFWRSGVGFVARGCGGSGLLFGGRGRLRIG